jgi:GWxTD domain-containing protein
MRRLGACAVSILLAAASAPAASLPELFQKAKSQIKGESWVQALATLSALEAEAGRPGNEAARQQLAAPLAFYRGVCEANLGNVEDARLHFAAFLTLAPNATMDPSMYSKKAIAAFQVARKNAAPAPSPEPDGRSSVFQAFQEFKIPPNPGETVNAEWPDGPIRWIMTAEEKQLWSELPLGADLQEFVDTFWKRRNPHPGNPDNVFRTSFERRVAFADASFAVAEGTRGSLTDRGMVFVLLGPPSYVGRKPIRNGEDINDDAGLSMVGSHATAHYQRALDSVGEPAGSTGAGATDAFVGPAARVSEASPAWREVWHYRSELPSKGVNYQQVDIEFITRRGYGVNVLQRDQATLAALDAAKVAADGQSREKMRASR